MASESVEAFEVSFVRWSLKNPGGSFRDFYADSVASGLSSAKQHWSLGSNLKDGSIENAKRWFDNFVALGLHPSDTVVDYGCGTLRVGAFFIEFLDFGRYVGMDIDQRILDAGRSQLSDELFDQKRPSLEVISSDGLARVAAQNVKWVFSKGVLQHVPPEDTDEYFANLSVLIRAGATGWLNAKTDFKTQRISPRTWIHDFRQLETDAQRYQLKIVRLGPRKRIFKLTALEQN
jgi:hypothetical protein